MEDSIEENENIIQNEDNLIFNLLKDYFKVIYTYNRFVIKLNDMNYYIPMSSPKKSDYKDDKIRKSIIPIVRIISNEEIGNTPVLKGTLRMSNMIPVPDSELILYEPKYEKNKNYKILVEKE